MTFTMAFTPLNALNSFIAVARVAVGTALASGPPHRSRRALLTHRALALDADAEAFGGPGMLDAGGRDPADGEPLHPVPVHP